MEKNPTATHVLPTQTQVVTQRPGQARVAPVSRLTRTPHRQYAGGAIGDIMPRTFSLVVCLAVLVATAVTLSTINTISSFAVYTNSTSNRAIAGWLLFIAIAAIIFHAAMIFIRVLYVTSTISQNFSGYAFSNAILCVVFGLAFLSGGIPSAVYGADNLDYHSSICSAFSTSAYCKDLETVYTSQFLAAAFSLMSVFALVPLFVATLCSGIQKWQEEANQDSTVTTASAPPYMPLLSSKW